MREVNARGKALWFSEDELAFYGAEQHQGLLDASRKRPANLRGLVKRILCKHGYLPDEQKKATRTVFEQAKVLSAGWAARSH